ncbi:uncharacterized protein LOC122045744 isoform X1 [Zingiber officinale]|uniref:uncharacterized protein LOC122045744 isoform X1 n=1 Tax=Zingiber officinale TaxID=94328 RepID=UPI001C4CBAE2|nr:uncharacterized protein LOC122045744 isoform X1 [Zingiber officinale]
MGNSCCDLARHAPYWSLWLWILLDFSFPSSIRAIRKDIGLVENPVCRNTVQGRYLLSDDNGYVCTALSVNSWTRCCPSKGDRFSCQGCNLVSHCCNSYEYCVSCCLDPSRTEKAMALKVKIAKPITSGTYSSVFDFCAGICRHNSASVVHENAYASEFHHCFSLQSNSTGNTEPNSEARLSGIDVVVGRLGESCNAVCSSRGKTCVPNRLLLLNRCDILQKYMNCKGGCFASIGSDQPAEVVEDAPKNMNPGACLYTQTESLVSCDGSHQQTKRLCPCA